MTVDVASLGLEIRSDGVVVASKRLREFEKKAGQAERSVTSLADKAQKAGRQMRDLGKSLSLGVTAPLVAMAAASVKTAATFESELTKINTLVGISREEIAGYREEILALAPAVGRGPQELARGLFAVTSAGARGAQAMETLTAAAKASAIGLGDTRDVALAATAAVTAYGSENLSASRAVEILVGTVEQGNLEASALAGSLGRVISIAAQAGVSFEEAGAFIAAFTRQGVSAEQAVTGLRGVLATLVREPTEGAKRAFAEMGTSADEFNQSIRDDGFISAFQEMINSAQDAGIQMGQIVPEIEALAGAMAVFSSKGESAADIAKNVGDAVGTLESRLQAAIEQDPALAYAQMTASLESMRVEIGANLLPVFLDLVEGVKDASTWFRDLDADTQRLVIQVAGVTAAVGPLLIVLGSITSSLVKLRPLVIFLAGPAGLAAVAAAAGVLIGYNLQQTFKDWANGADSLSAKLQDLTPKMNRFTGEVARLREEFLRSQLDQAKADLEAIGRVIDDIGARQRLGVTGSQYEQAQARVNELTRALEINQARWDAHNQRVIEADNGIGAFGSNLHTIVDMAFDAADAIEAVGSSASGSSDEIQSFDEWLQQTVESLDEAKGKADRYAQSMIAIASVLLQATTGMRAFNTESNRSTGDGFFPDFGALDAALDSMQEIREEMEEAAAIEWNFENLIDSFNPLSQAMRRLGDDIDLVNARIENGQMGDMEGMFVKSATAADAAFNAMKAGVDRTSKEYQQLEVAQQAVNVAMGIAAILQQGMGDPYTAIPRMIAMAAMVAQLVDGVSGLSGSGGGGAASRQEIQGTGSVLGDSEAKSESIANAVEITADATSELVGINRGMLHSLQALQDGLTGAATLVARGAGQADMSGVNIDLSALSEIHSAVWDPLGFFGGSAVKDQGIKLLGGLISDLTEGAVGVAFADVKKWNLFSSSRKTVTEDLGEEFNDQLNLIFESMIDTVKSAGEALGIPLAELESRIASFEVAAQEISLKDLSAEEAQAELAAVFSSIFDDLASHVIPFIDQFQRIGEGMGETLVRVATSVQVTEEAIRRLGLNISENLGPERMAQVSVGLVEASGGIEQFITDMENFMSKFAPEAHQFEVAQSDITRALDQMGYSLPKTRDGFWELIQSIDGTTEAGQRQIATLLSLTDAADAYYSAVEEIEQERAGLQQRILQLEGDTAALREIELSQLDESNRALQRRIWALEKEADLSDFVADVNQQLLQELSPAHANLNRLMTAFSAMMSQARELGASEETLMNIRRLHSAQLNAMANTLRAGIADAVDSLFGSDQASSFESTASSISNSMGNIQRSMIDAIKGVQDWLDSSLLGSNSPLMPQEQLNAAGSQFWDAIEAAQAGNAEAASNLPQLADQFLGQAGSFLGTSTAEYQEIWNMVRDAMQGVADMDVAQEAGPPTYGQTANIEQATQETAQSAYEQMIQAQHLVGQIDALSRITSDSPADIAEELGVPIGELIELMGEDPANTAAALEDQFNSLVIGFGDTLNPLMGVEQKQLEELRNIVELMGGEAETSDKPIDLTAPLPGDQTGGQMEGAHVIPAGGALIHESPQTVDQFKEMNLRLQRLEELIETNNRHSSDTASNTGRQAVSLAELVVINRDAATRPAPAPMLQ